VNEDKNWLSDRNDYINAGRTNLLEIKGQGDTEDLAQ
jgi:hypothetical protein